MANRYLGRGSHFAGSLVLIMAVFWFVAPGEVVARLQATDLHWVAIGVLSLTVITACMAWRWQWVAQGLGLDLRYGPALREYYLSQLVNQLIPGGVVGDAARAVRLRGHGDLERAATSVIIDRVLGQVALFTLLGVALVVDLVRPGGLPWPRWTGVALALGIGAGFILWYARRGSGTVARGLVHLRTHVASLRQIGLNIVITALMVFSFYACCVAVGAPLPIHAVAILVPLILSTMLIPLSVGGWGWREGAAAALFPLVGLRAEEGIAAGIVYGAVLLIAALPAVFCLLPRTATAPPET